MRTRTIEKLLYKVAALLVVIGIGVRIMNLSESYLDLYLILAGLVVGVIAIFMYMKYVLDMEQQNQPLKGQAKQLKNN